MSGRNMDNLSSRIRVGRNYQCNIPRLFTEKERENETKYFQPAAPPAPTGCAAPLYEQRVYFTDARAPYADTNFDVKSFCVSKKKRKRTIRSEDGEFGPQFGEVRGSTFPDEFNNVDIDSFAPPPSPKRRATAREIRACASRDGSAGPGRRRKWDVNFTEAQVKRLTGSPPSSHAHFFVPDPVPLSSGMRSFGEILDVDRGSSVQEVENIIIPSQASQSSNRIDLSKDDDSTPPRNRMTTRSAASRQTGSRSPATGEPMLTRRKRKLIQNENSASAKTNTRRSAAPQKRVSQVQTRKAAPKPTSDSVYQMYLQRQPPTAPNRPHPVVQQANVKPRQEVRTQKQVVTQKQARLQQQIQLQKAKARKQLKAQQQLKTQQELRNLENARQHVRTNQMVRPRQQVRRQNPGPKLRLREKTQQERRNLENARQQVRLQKVLPQSIVWRNRSKLPPGRLAPGAIPGPPNRMSAPGRPTMPQQYIASLQRAVASGQQRPPVRRQQFGSAARLSGLQQLGTAPRQSGRQQFSTAPRQSGRQQFGTAPRQQQQYISGRRQPGAVAAQGTNSLQVQQQYLREYINGRQSIAIRPTAVSSSTVPGPPSQPPPTIDLTKSDGGVRSPMNGYRRLSNGQVLNNRPPNLNSRPPIPNSRPPNLNSRPPNLNSRPPNFNSRLPNPNSRPPILNSRPPNINSRPPRTGV
eukprot:197401_1